MPKPAKKVRPTIRWAVIRPSGSIIGDMIFSKKIDAQELGVFADVAKVRITAAPSPKRKRARGRASKHAKR